MFATRNYWGGFAFRVRFKPLVTGRSADYLEPELEEARKRIGDLARDDFDLLIYALYPTTGEQFLKWKYNLEERPLRSNPRP